MVRGSTRKQIASILGVTALAAVGALIPITSANAEVVAPASSTVSTTPLPTVQINSGVVWSQAIVGNTVWAGGSFTDARPAGAAPGENLTPRSNLLAYDITTGNLIDSIAPQVNGQVKVVRSSPDGSRIYIGGSFSQVDGEPRANLAALDANSGALITDFRPTVSGPTVNAIAVTGSNVYVGGRISGVDGTPRGNMAAFDLSGQLTGWSPTTERQVDAMVATADGSKIIIGGRFGTVNGAESLGLAAVDPSNGSVLAWTASGVIRNGGSDSMGISGLSTDGDAVYGTAWAQIGGGHMLEGSFSADAGSGEIRWIEDCHGDEYGIYSDGTTVYTVGHTHDCTSLGGFGDYATPNGRYQYALAFTKATMGTLGRANNLGSYTDWSGNPAPGLMEWYPNFLSGTATGMGQAGWDVTGNGEYVVIGGEFPGVNNQHQQGLVRFGH